MREGQGDPCLHDDDDGGSLVLSDVAFFFSSFFFFFAYIDFKGSLVLLISCYISLYSVFQVLETRRNRR